MTVEYTPVTDYAAVVEALAAKKIDLAWLGGFTFVQARLRTGDAIPIVQRASRFIPTRPENYHCLLYTSPSPRDGLLSRMPSSA